VCRQVLRLEDIRGRLAGMVSYALILGVRLYQHTLRLFFPPSCRFHPSCSEYAVEALKKFGPVKGAWLSLRRLSRCHPFNPGGYDPLP
jgi:putative membrane protein insertion efficiency factor